MIEHWPLGRPRVVWATFLSAGTPKPDRRAMRICVSAFIALIFLLGRGPVLWAADDTQAFVDALSGRGYYDLALEYLETIPQSGVASAEFKKSLPFQRGTMLAAKSRKEASAANRERLVEQARRELESFAKANSNSADGADAYMELAMLLRENAATAIYKAKTMPPGSDEREAEWADARSNYDAARDNLAAAEKSFTDLLSTFPKAIPPAEKEKINQRLTYRARLAQARLYQARCSQDKANAYVKGAKEAVALHEQALQELQALYDKYSGFTVGFQARQFQGESYLAVGKIKEATGCFEDIIVSGAEAVELRDLVTVAHSYQAEAYVADKKYDMVLNKSALWLAKVRGAEAQEPAWLRLKYQVAEAARLKAAEPDTKEADKRKLLAQARELYRSAGRYLNEFQREARLTLSQMAADGDAALPQTFTEAYQAAKDAVNSMNAARLAVNAAKVNNPDAVAALEQQAEQGFDEALDNLELALRLVDDDTELKKLNETRYLLSWLYWQRENFYRSAVLGDFVARRYSNDPIAESAAKITLAALEKLYTRARESGDGEFESAQLNEMAGYVTRRWPTSQTAELAFGVILNFALKENRFNEARAQIAELDEQRRPLFEAKLGTAMWEAQLRAAASKEPVAFDPATVRAEAKKLIQSSIVAVAADPTADSTLAAASLYLSQAYLGDGEYGEAIKLLEDDKTGSLALMRTSNAVASRPAFKLEALKTALRAYVAATPPQTDKAVAMMAELEKAAEGAGGADVLTSIYVGIGLQLKQQIDELTKAGKYEEAERVTEAFATFLAKIREGGESLSFPVRQWIASTYYNLGEASKVDEKRKVYFTGAREEFKTLLDAVTANPNISANPNTKLAIQLQLGNSLRELEEYQAAFTLFEEILAEREMMLDIQKAAAYTLQDWGASAGDNQKIEQALAGAGRKNDKGQNVVWGWSRLSKVAAAAQRQAPQWRDLFFECWVNIGRSRYLMGMNSSGAEKTKYLKKAKEVVRAFHSSYKDLGGEERRAEFDALMKDIQTAGSERPIGLEEITGEKEKPLANNR